MSVNKTTPTRASTRAKIADTRDAQPAAERWAAEGELKGLIEKFAPAHVRLIATARKALRKRLPSAHEVVYEYRDCFVISFSPSGHGYEGVLGIRANGAGMRLFFNRAKELADPEKLLRGSGALARWVEIESAAAMKRPAIVRLIEEAIARNEVAFDDAGRGSVVVRLTTAKKRVGGGRST